MTSTNRYLGKLGIDRQVTSFRLRFFAICFSVLLAFFLLWRLTSRIGEVRDPTPPLAAVGLVALAVIVWRMKRLPRPFAAAEDALLEDRFDDAITSARAGMGGSRPHPWLRAQALLIAGVCAERAGDFREAAEVFAHTRETLARVGATMRNQLGPLAAAREAFVLAAVGCVDDAERTLAMASGPIAIPGTKALALRARLLVDMKRARYSAVIDTLRAERALVRGSLVARDQMLVWAIGAVARRALEQPPANCPFPAPAALSHWIDRVIEARSSYENPQ